MAIRWHERLVHRALLTISIALCAGPGSSLAAQESYDVLIRGGRVLDGSGNPWTRADVALRGDRVVAVGDLSGARAATEIDATGLYVAPGFIDAHSHAGGGLASEGLSHARPLLAQGVTTVFVNPDGGGPVDIEAQRESLLEHGLGVNAAQLVPHGSVRSAVIGSADRPATATEMARMEALVRAGMEAGAFGLSSGTFYQPGFFAPNEELVTLARAVSDFGGAYTSHIRDESDYGVGLLASVEEVIEVAREAGIPGVVTHVKALGPPVWGFSQAIVHRIERARQVGVEVWADQYPYVASATGLSAALIPRWAQAGGGDSLRARMADPETGPRIRAEVVENLARRGGADRIQFRRFSADPAIEGRTLADVARERGTDPVDEAFRLLEQGGPSIVSFNMHENDVRTLMAQPWTMTASDGDLVQMGVGVPHPRSYGTFSRKIQKYVVEDEVVDLSFAIRSMTSLPASVFRVADRGLLIPGAYADVVVFDLAGVREVGTFSDPHHLSEGMVHVFVNGQPAIRGGEFTGAMPGRVLRR
jgi:N-acyl-D-aspartate/D-glutamate deacylase